jgi:hypothetical protein
VELVKQIARMPSDPRSNLPFHPVKINHITIVKAGSSAPAPKASSSAAKKPATAPKATAPSN